MDRRELLKHLAVLTGAVLLVPSCTNLTKDDLLAAYGNLNITAKEKELLDWLCRLIIPADAQVKGADELLIGDFVVLQANDCLPENRQKSFMDGLRDFGVQVSGLDDNQATQLLITHFKENNLAPGGRSGDGQDVEFFLSSLKKWAIEGFTTSKYFMTEIMPYQLVPGAFHGKVKIVPGEKINIYG